MGRTLWPASSPSAHVKDLEPVLWPRASRTEKAISAAEVARIPADGYTLLLGVPASQSIGPALRPKLPYDCWREFTPINSVGSVVARVWKLHASHMYFSSTPLLVWVRQGLLPCHGRASFYQFR